MAVTIEELHQAVHLRLIRFAETSDRADLMAAAGVRDAEALVAAATELRGWRRRKSRAAARQTAGLLHYARDLLNPNERDERAARDLFDGKKPVETELLAASRRDRVPGAPLPPVEALAFTTQSATLASLDALIATIRLGVSDPVTVDDLSYLIIMADAQESRWGRTQDPADLGEAVETVRQAIAHTPPDHRWYPNRLSRLGGLLQYLFVITGNTSALDEAITFAKAAVAAVTPSTRTGRCSSPTSGGPCRCGWR